MVPLLLLTACLERVTGEAVPLDPRFYEGGGDAANPGGGAGQLGVPWASTPGDKVDLRFAVTGLDAGTLQLDVLVADPAKPGGVDRLGRIETADSPIVLSVPTSVKGFTVEILQDPGQDGPSDDDPYATLTIDMAALPEGEIPVVLVVGARPAPTGGGAGGGGGVSEPWSGAEGARVPFSCVVSTDDEGEIQVDVTEPDPSAPGGQRRVGQLRLPVAGAFTLEVPATVQSFRLEVFQDRAGDGPDAGDPYAESTVTVASIGTDPLALTLVAGSRGAAGSGAVPAPGGPGGGGEPMEPWADATGPTATFRATVVAPGAGDVQVDVNEADSTAPGGQRRVGARVLAGSGELSFAVPLTVKSFKLEAFQDPGHDGPSESDPYAELTVTAAQVATPATLTLVAGSRGRPGTPTPPPAPGSADTPVEGTVLLSGTVRAPGAGKVAVDVFAGGAAAGAARKHLYKVETTDGAWKLRVAASLGPVEIEAYQDAVGDGPSPGDPRGRYAKDVAVGTADLSGLDLTLE